MITESPDQTEEERLQQSLFIDLLSLAPEGAELYITNDSWDELPSILGNWLRVVREDNYNYWVVTLTPESRMFLVQQTLHSNIHIAFVHFTIKANQHEFFVSHDRMVSISLAPSFPDYERLGRKYASILMF